VGEVHPELPLDSLIASLGLSAHVRHIDFAPIEDFNGYIGACDIVLNLRYPTVGESSGTLLRALGMGKAVVVSDVGSFREYPDEVCLKAPVDSSEEDHLFEFLNLLVSRPHVAQALGARARDWVARECNWETVAQQYVDFLAGKPTVEPTSTKDAPAASEPAHVVPAEYIVQWAPVENGARAYVEDHLTRLEKTLAITPPGGPGDHILEMGAYLQITPALRSHLGYGHVRGCYYGAAGTVEHRSVTSASGEEFQCDIDLFNAEKDPFPYANDCFTTVLCCELIEHLFEDPMHLMSEVNRVVRPGGSFVLTTPNITALRGIAAILQGFHPGFFHAYIRPSASGEVEARHNREYTPREVRNLMENSGFAVTRLETGPFFDEPRPQDAWVVHLLERYGLSTELRGDGIYCVRSKTGPVRERYPSWLYS
jgi:SAM-dependent methyltransferase